MGVERGEMLARFFVARCVTPWSRLLPVRAGRALYGSFTTVQSPKPMLALSALASTKDMTWLFS
jgi:hypothetical protein